MKIGKRRKKSFIGSATALSKYYREEMTKLRFDYMCIVGAHSSCVNNNVD